MASMYQTLDRRASSSVLWATLLLISSTVIARDLNPVDNFCGRWYQQSVIKNDVLFIDSGVQKWNVTPNSTTFYGINNNILTIPLTSTWDWKTNIKIDIHPKNETNPNTGTLPPSLTRGHMFHGPAEDASVYIYGGTTYQGNRSFDGYRTPDASTYSLWTYAQNSSGYPWMQYDLSLPWIPNHGAVAEAIDQKRGFYLNGQIDWGTSTSTLNWTNVDAYVPLDGMLILDLENQTATNISTPGIGGGAPRVGGTMEYFAPVGGMGILVALGGMVKNSSQQSALLNYNHGKLIDFATVDVFDINSYLDDPESNGKWYQQKTSGTIPEPRIDFCTVAISAPDNSSHHIYLYSGIDPNKGQEKSAGYDDVYVLSIPSFTWTPIFQNGQAPRWGHNCHVAGKRQMVTVGGNITNTGICDWELKGVAFLDLTTATWGSVFLSNSSDYQVPKQAFPATGGNATGFATIHEPAKGWTDSGLQTVFNTPRKWSLSAPTEKKKTNTGAIAGGVVGGVAGLALIAGLLFFLRRRHTQRRAPGELDNNEISRNELSDQKDKHELQAVNESEPAELPGPEMAELHAPREVVEADHITTTNRAELSGTNVVAGGLHGVPIVRTPGDDLPSPPLSAPGLSRPPRSDDETLPPRASQEAERVESAAHTDKPR
ncbi:hypothetical protein EJ04DRAFT_286272 [Polyplosphaeria fusca]|uniref:Kelch repeat protein n=1 Tax=Polyplosphaeria fusca TaxID=682080 RepID=A0A9P4R693_9PLEO|nr:hypothetical protein EJ04DRAFT_286272 [Polyplosphaeria fusca]